MNYMFEIILVVLIFVISFISGILLTKKGRPLNTKIFSGHKLSALALFVFSGITIYNLVPFASNPAQQNIILFSVIFIFLVLISGIYLSFDKLDNNTIRIFHKILPLVMIISIIAVYYFIQTSK